METIGRVHSSGLGLDVWVRGFKRLKVPICVDLGLRVYGFIKLYNPKP